MSRRPIALVLALVVLASLAAALAADDTLVLATTTSTADTGLLDELLPRFTAATKIVVKPIAVGSGEALAMGKRGDADVLLVHSKAAEDQFMAEGFGAERFEVMFNDFVLVGPAADPAGAKGKPVLEAVKAIAEKGALFVSRDDQSGTHKKEQELFKRAGVETAGKPWYLRTGQGMGETARVTSEKQAYTLIDRGTWLALRASLKLEIVSEKAKDLLNTYRVIVVNPAKNPNVKTEAARTFARWLLIPDTQEFIGSFGKAKFGQPLFTPNAQANPPAAPAAK